MDTSTTLGLIGIILTIGGLGYKITRAFSRLEYILTGANGENGIRADVASIKTGQAQHTDDIKDIKRTLHGDDDADENALVYKIGVIERRLGDITPNPGRRRGDNLQKRRMT